MHHLISLISHLPKELAIMLIAAIPVLELRASIPFAMLMEPKFSAWTALWLSVIGSWLPAFFILFVLEHLEPILRKNKFINNLLDKVYARTRAKSESIKELEFIGLVLFIGVPLPGTGVWTGVLAAYLFGLSKIKALLAGFLGTLIAGILMVFLSQYIGLIIKYFFLILAFSFLGYFAYKFFKKKK